jgi:hypothetical protein
VATLYSWQLDFCCGKVYYSKTLSLLVSCKFSFISNKIKTQLRIRSVPPPYTATLQLHVLLWRQPCSVSRNISYSNYRRSVGRNGCRDKVEHKWLMLRWINKSINITTYESEFRYVALLVERLGSQLWTNCIVTEGQNCSCGVELFFKTLSIV